MSFRVLSFLAICLMVFQCVFAMEFEGLTWGQYKAKYGKAYTPAEDTRREANFHASQDRAQIMQAKNPKATFGDNQFSDLSVEEFRSVYHNGQAHFKQAIAANKNAVKTGVSAEETLKRPQSVDWRQKGAVTHVKNQGQCGSCWSFSTTGSIEGQWFLAGHTLVSLSEQDLVSCDHTCNGCQGGLMTDAFEWLIQSRGGWITSASEYPYVSGQGQVPACRSSVPKVAQITSYKNVEHSESSMATFLAMSGPLSIAVDASSWQTYKSGIMTNCVSTQVDHGVLAVGYNMAGATPYWIIKNSWTPQWGEEGYIYVEYGKDECLITSAPSQPVASKGPAPPPGPPSPPSPPSPPTPPTPSGGTFTQYQCPDFLCLDNCQGHTFAQGKCLQMNGGGSAIAECSSTELSLSVYQNADCSGSAQTERQPLDKCLKDESGTYIYNKCTSGAAANKTLSVGSKFMMSKRSKKM